jgi:hypothetical protein
MRKGRAISLGAGMQRMVTSIGGREHADKAKVTQVWLGVVGEQVAKHTAVRGVDRGRLLVDVDSSVWATQLQIMSDQLREGVNAEIGRRLVRTIVFRVSQEVEKNQSMRDDEQAARRGYGGDKVQPRPLAEGERRAAEDLVADVQNQGLREAILAAIVAEKEWQKGQEAEPLD